MMIEEYRKEIDRIDESVLKLLAKRFSIVQKIGEIKKEYNLPAFDEKRYEEITQSHIELAKEFGLERKFAKEIFETIHRESLRIQE